MRFRSGRSRLELPRDPGNQQTRRAIGQRIYRKRQGQNGPKQHRPKRRSDQRIANVLHCPKAGIGPFQTGVGHDGRQHGLCGIVAEHLGHADCKR